jgi:hypothetical protein
MTLKKAITTTAEDFFKRDPEMPRWLWIGASLAILCSPILPGIVVLRWIGFKPPERNPDYRGSK